MPEVFRSTRRVEFCETDAAGIAHFSAFFLYMEQAEHALLRHLGMSVIAEDAEGMISWPRVQADCSYSGAVGFEDVLDIDLSVERLGQRSVKYSAVFLKQGREVARGGLTAVCCRLVAGQPPRSIPIPAWIADRLRPYAG